MMHSIETFTGRMVDLVRPQSDSIRLIDIIWGLSRTPRFNGHTLGRHPYSVAQHSVWVARAALRYCGADPTMARYALLHDAHEAYSGDLVQPLKTTSHLQFIHLLEARMQEAILQAFELPLPSPRTLAVIRACDRMALAVEARHLMFSAGKGWAVMSEVEEDVFSDFWDPQPAEEAYRLFEDAWHRLAQGRDLEGLCA